MANPTGKSGPRDKPFRDALRMEIAAAGENHKELRRIARALLETAAEGDVSAINAVADRLDGKVPTPVVGDADHPGVIDPRAFFAWMKDTDREASSLPTTDEPNASLKSWPIDGQAKQ